MIDTATNMEILLFKVSLEKAVNWLMAKASRSNLLGNFVGEESCGGNIEKLLFERKVFYYDGNRGCLLG